MQIKAIDSTNSVNVICVEKGYCEKPITYGPDPQDIPIYKIDLDLPGNLRCMCYCFYSCEIFLQHLAYKMCLFLGAKQKLTYVYREAYL